MLAYNNLDETIKVYVRVRPLLEDEIKKQMKSCLENINHESNFLTSKANNYKKVKKVLF